MPNELADSTSPYLRAHADNPVDWRMWTKETLAEVARRELPGTLRTVQRGDTISLRA